VPLLERSLAMTRTLRFDVRLELDLAEAERSALKKAAIAEQAAERAQRAGDQAGEALAVVAAASARLFFADDPRSHEVERLARAALPLLEQAADHVGLARVWGYLGSAANLQGRFEEWAQAEEESLRHLRLAGENPLGLGDAHGGLLAGPRPADEALRTLDAALPPNPQPLALLGRARLLAMLSRFDEAWQLALPAAERLREVSGEALGEFALGEIAVLAGDHATAADHLRRTCDIFERRGNRATLSTYAPMLGRSLCMLGRCDEAESLAQLGRDLGYEEDLVTQMLWRQVQALVHAHRGEHAEAELLARQAVGIADRTDGLNNQGDALCDLADVLSTAGRGGEAAAALEQALDRYERKRNLAMTERVREQLANLRSFPAPAEPT
jgi:tetratricopeptide (TPR) repeat protein